MEFKERLNTSLETADRLQTDLAKHLGLQPQSVQQWCDGGTMPRKKRIPIIAKYLGCNPIWLETGADPINTGKTYCPACANQMLINRCFSKYSESTKIDFKALNDLPTAHQELISKAKKIEELAGMLDVMSDLIKQQHKAIGWLRENSGEDITKLSGFKDHSAVLDQ